VPLSDLVPGDLLFYSYKGTVRVQNEVGPYQSPMEDGMQHFHEWYRQKLKFTDQ